MVGFGVEVGEVVEMFVMGVGTPIGGLLAGEIEGSSALFGNVDDPTGLVVVVVTFVGALSASVFDEAGVPEGVELLELEAVELVVEELGNPETDAAGGVLGDVTSVYGLRLSAILILS